MHDEQDQTRFSCARAVCSARSLVLRAPWVWLCASTNPICSVRTERHRHPCSRSMRGATRWCDGVLKSTRLGRASDGSVSTATSVVRGQVRAKSWILCVVSDFDGRLHVMKTSSKLAGSLCAVALALTPVLGSAANLTPSAILSSTQSNDGQAVTVDGKVKEFITKQTRRFGTVSMYQICDQQCINVVDPSGGTQTNDSTVTASGTFHTSLKGRNKTFTNVIVVGH